jgi:hypothetical protein
VHVHDVASSGLYVSNTDRKTGGEPLSSSIMRDEPPDHASEANRENGHNTWHEETGGTKKGITTAQTRLKPRL